LGYNRETDIKGIGSPAFEKPGGNSCALPDRGEEDFYFARLNFIPESPSVRLEAAIPPGRQAKDKEAV